MTGKISVLIYLGKYFKLRRKPETQEQLFYLQNLLT